MFDGLDRKRLYDLIEDLELLVVQYVPNGVYEQAEKDHALILLRHFRDVFKKK